MGKTMSTERWSKQVAVDEIAGRNTVKPTLGPPKKDGARTMSEHADGVLPRMFGGRTVNDGTGMIKIAAESVTEADGRLTVAVEVNWPMILANAVARLYLVADGNREPLLAQVLLVPDIVPPHVCF